MSEQLKVKELSELYRLATSGNWYMNLDTSGAHAIGEVKNEHGIVVVKECYPHDARFIAEAHNMVPALLSRIYELEAQNEQIKQRVKECARLFHEYTEIVHRMEVIQNEMQSTAQAKKKKPHRRNRSCYR